jgi:hypothetical protein
MENHRTYSASITFRFDSDNIENLQKEAYNRGISLTSLTNQIVKEFFEWHIFEPKIGFVPILKPVVEELFAKMSKEQISQIAANTGKEEFKNALQQLSSAVENLKLAAQGFIEGNFSSIILNTRNALANSLLTQKSKNNPSEKNGP